MLLTSILADFGEMELLGYVSCFSFVHFAVKYEAQLEDGTVVSKSEGNLHVLPLQPSYFCPALSKVVKTMKKGEKVLLTVWLWGDGSASLITLKLVSWKTATEVTNDRKVIKKIIKDGEGYERPNEGTMAKVELIGKLQDGTVFLKKGHDDVELFEFKMDDEQVTDGLDRAVMTMKKGEVAELTSAPEYGFGSSESKQELAVVPPNSTLYYEVELESFVKERKSWDMNTPEIIEAAGKKKEEGSVAFRAGKYAKASKRYEQVSCNLNNAACKLKLKDYKQAEKLCTKALYRRAQAYIRQADLDLAEIDIKKALEIDPNNRKQQRRLQSSSIDSEV
ncbi:hypothetical protein IFM89_038852 [Coptis chinensis]|uniref:peptidylprolyl isomerase n=1 Tax=Coptis chinensis TaxID=261450 RepID=A0A835I9P1_9MAGN|nr:hypothetical protein IFM89_038852 [Coptis chinensis]